jgi:2-polyprenyl-3-methyl-5-hydroxy-6-metoxy-1,4-benzoquinol methylase/glycosyltransferase involved in cell wall biosynthesis
LIQAWVGQKLLCSLKKRASINLCAKTFTNQMSNTDSEMANLLWTGERYLPSIHGGVELEHFHRYLFAEQIVKGKRVLDIASGEGYGSALLARSAAYVTGVDISAEAVVHAKVTYHADNLTYLVGSCAAIPLPDHSIDIVVSFETIEHHDQHEAMMSEIKRVLTVEGVLLISCPDKYEYSDKTGYRNEYHVKELYREEFVHLLAAYFKCCTMFGQRAVYGSLILQSVGGLECETYKIDDKLAPPVDGLANAVYLIAIASDVQIPTVKAGLLDQALESISEISDRDVWISKLHETTQSLIVDRDAQKAGYEQLKAEMRNRESQCEDLLRKVSERDAWIAKHEETIQSLIVDRAMQKAGYEQLKAEMRNRESQCEDLLREVSERDVWIAKHEETIQSLIVDRDVQMAGYEQLKVELGNCESIFEDSLSRLQAKVDDIPALKEELWAVRRSRSWRITSPLRVLANLLRRFLLFNEVPTQVRSQASTSQVPYPLPPVLAHEQEQDGNGTGEAYSPTSDSITEEYCVLLASYYCPTRAHAGGLRILDTYALIRRQRPDARIDLYTHNRPDIDWSLDDAERIFDNIYFARTEDLNPDELRHLQGGFSPHYDLVDLQFHQTARRLAEFRKLGAKLIFTPMESQAKALYLDIATKFKAGKALGFRSIAASIQLAIEEIGYCRKADEVVCVSETDASFLRLVSGIKKIRSIETGISQIEFGDALRPDFILPDPAVKKVKIIYVAYFGSQTNINALIWFLEKVHPLIKQKVPDYLLSVVGRGDMLPFQRYRDNCLELVGEVPEIAPHILEARVGIAPGLGGAGLRGKVNQYAVLGVPCVVSPVALQGLAYTDEKNVCVAEAPEKFAADCVRLLTDMDFNRYIAQAARSLSIERYSWQSKWPQICSAYAVKGKL